MYDEIIHSTQNYPYIKYINRAMLADLQTIELGRPIVLQEMDLHVWL